MITLEAQVPASADRRDLLFASESFVPGWESFGRPTPTRFQLHYPDGTVFADAVVEQWRNAMAAGPELADAPHRVQATLEQRAAQALETNRTYLALSSPTAAQTAAQVRALTRQVQALIRLNLGVLDGTD